VDLTILRALTRDARLEMLIEEIAPRAASGARFRQRLASRAQARRQRDGRDPPLTPS
jgi:hypothetical protein